jgi:hypothetical protein
MVGFANATWTRKPNRIEEIRGRVKRSELPEYVYEAWPDELWGCNDIPDLMLSFKQSLPHYFILVTEKGEYLVNTEGYDYCRYVAKIEED